MATTPRSALPTGDVTFLFSDIEGSTRLLAALGERYAPLLDRHNELLRAAWQGNDGVEVSTDGDAFFVAFRAADDAVRAAVAAQRAVAAEAWPDDGVVRVRIGIHSGWARPHRDDYVALAVNQAARVVGTAHGGQVVLSEGTHRQLSAEVAAATSDLGLHRVRDFDEPLRLFRVVARGWSDPGRPPRARPAEGHNLAQPVGRRVDRDADLAWLEQQLVPGTVTSLVGPGGVGKTRLALEAGLRAVPAWPDGVWSVDLAAVGASELVAEAVADALGAGRTPGRSAQDDAVDHLADRRLLLLLDNCEHVVDAVGTLVARLRDASPGLAVLTTSRLSLGLRSEVVRRVEPLSTRPDGGDAAALFRDRAPELADDEAEALTRLCVELDGLPLAIELAAAHAAAVPPSGILERLRARPTFLTSRDPTLPARQRSLTALLDSSLELLDGASLEVLRRVALLPATFDVALALVACADAGLGREVVDDATWGLVEASLLVPDTSAGATRFRLPHTVRAHVLTLLPEPQRRATAVALARHFVARLGPERATGRGWISELSLELDNVRALVDEVADVDGEAAQELAWSIARLHQLRNQELTGIAEAQEHLDRLTAATPGRVGLLTMLAHLVLHTGDGVRATDLLDEADELRGRVGAPAWDDAGIPRLRGEVALRAGDDGAAIAWGRRALATATTPRSRARAWSILGVAHAFRGDMLAARDAFDHELDEVEGSGLDTFAAKAHANLGEVHLRLGNVHQAARHQAACLEIGREQGERRMVAFSALVAARLLADADDHERAATMHAAAHRAIEEHRYVLYEADAAIVEQYRKRLHEALGDTAFAAAERRGHELGLTGLVDEAAAVLERIADQGSD